MTRRKTTGPPAKGTLGRAVYDDLVGMLADTKEHPPGSRLPSYMALCQGYGVSPSVVSDAMLSLAYEGRVVIGPGGVTVQGKLPRPASGSGSSDSEPSASVRPAPPPTAARLGAIVRECIENGTIEPGEPVFTALAEEFGVSRSVLLNALAPCTRRSCSSTGRASARTCHTLPKARNGALMSADRSMTKEGAHEAEGLLVTHLGLGTFMPLASTVTGDQVPMQLLRSRHSRHVELGEQPPVVLPKAYDTVRVRLALGLLAVDDLVDACGVVGPLRLSLTHHQLNVSLNSGRTDRWLAPHSVCLPTPGAPCSPAGNQSKSCVCLWMTRPRPSCQGIATGPKPHRSAVRSPGRAT
ncbi:GntR family transcriptional regulator [Streptomyces sp. NPDC001478]